MSRFFHLGVCLLLLAGGRGHAQSQDTTPEVVPPPQAWLGVQLAKPEPSMVAHLPDLPKGMGFLVSSVDRGGPADQAGVATFDVIWKLDDQML